VERATTRTRASAFFLVYNPGRRPTIFTGADGLTRRAQHQQLGSFSAGRQRGTHRHARRENNVNLLVETVLLNYTGAAQRARHVRDPVPEPRSREQHEYRSSDGARADRERRDHLADLIEGFSAL
jgi:hypothetical protein